MGMTPNVPLKTAPKKNVVPQGAFEKFCAKIDRLMKAQNIEIAKTILCLPKNKKALSEKKPDEQLTLAKKLAQDYLFENHVAHLRRSITRQLTEEAMFKHIPTIAELIIKGLPPIKKPEPKLCRNIIGIPQH